MFGKLLKNDLKAQWHLVSTVYLVSIIVAAVAEGLALFSKSDVTKVIAVLLVMVVLFFTSLIALITVAIMFSDTLFGRAGYLSLTLPVKTSSLVLSKTVTGLIWIFVAYGLFIGSLVLGVSQLSDIMGEELAESAEGILTILGMPSFFSMFISAVIFCICFASVILVFVQSIYLAISLSNVAPISKFGKFGAVVIFFAVAGIVYGITSKIGSLWNMGIVIGENTLYFTSNVMTYLGKGYIRITMFTPLLQVVAGILMHFPITAIVKNKVDIK